MHPRTLPLSPLLDMSRDMSVGDWRDFNETCEAEIKKGGERGAIAARMLDIGNRLRSLSARVDQALERFAS